MSILFSHNKCDLLDHRDVSLKIYKDVVKDEELFQFALKTELFCINSIAKKENVSRKRRHDMGKILDETNKINEMYENFLKKIPENITSVISKKYNVSDTSAVRDLSKQLFETTVCNHIGTNGGNNSETPILCEINEESFLLPEKSRFYCGPINEQCQKLVGNKYDILIADPPWWNKYIRRLKGSNPDLSYSMMYNDNIESIPVKELLAENCLVAVWCTNAPSNISAVKELIFPKWGLEYVTTWHWLKVTRDLKPLCAFNSACKKQPYERLILGKVGNVKRIPEEKLFMSVPSALHSHKPPLIELLSPYVTIENPQVLELFARYLLPNTTSVGYEPLKWQALKLYETVCRTKPPTELAT